MKPSSQRQSTQETIVQLWQQAKDLQEQGKSDATLEVYRSILKLDDRYLPALHKVAQICESRGEFAQAIEVYQKAIEVDDEPPFWVYRHLGFALSQKGELEAATEAYRQAISLQLDDVATHNLLGQVRGKLGDLEGAVSSYGKAIELQPEQPSWVYLNFAEALERQGHNDRAIAAYEKALALEPENEGIRRLLQVVVARKEASKVDRFELAQQLQQQGKLEEALAEYRAVLAEDGSNLAALHQVAKICEGQRKWDEAVEAYRKAVEVDAEPPFWVYRHLGFALSQRGDWDEAIDAYEKAVELNSEDGAAQILLGQEWEKNGDLARAVKSYQRAIEIDPKQPPEIYINLGTVLSRLESMNPTVELPKGLSAEEYLTQGDIWFGEQNWAGAIVAYEKAIDLNPGLVWAHYNLGRVLVQQGQLERAILAYERTIETEPGFPDVYQTLGDILLNQKRFEEAVSVYRQGLDFSSNKVWVYYNLGRALVELDRVDEAMEAYSRSIEIDPRFLQAYKALERIFVGEKRWEDAEKLYSQALELQLDWPDVFSKLGKVLLELKQWNRVIEIYSDLVKVRSYDSEIHEGLGDAYRNKAESPTDLDEAMKCYESAVSLQPSRLSVYHKMLAIKPHEAQIYSDLGSQLEHQDRIDGAILFYEMARTIDSEEICYSLKLQRVIEQKNKTLDSPVAARDVIDQEQLRKSLKVPYDRQPLVSVIIPVYNKVGYTLNCLYSLAENIDRDTSVEILVVDDGSSDETQHFLQDIEGLRFVQNPENMGFIKSCNHGASQAKGKYLCFLNNDTEVCGDWLESMIRVFEDVENVGVVGSKLVYPNGMLQEAGGIIWSNASGWNYGRMGNPDIPEYNYTRPVDYCSGASILVEKEIFESFGGFEKDFAPAYYEDTDLCFAVRSQLGLKVIYQPKSQVIHYEGISSGTSTSSGTKRYQDINAVKFNRKWEDVLPNHCSPGHPLNPLMAPRRLVGDKVILIIEHDLPFYDKESGYRRIYEIVKILKQLNYHVIYAPDSGSPDEPYVSQLQEMGVEVLYQTYNYAVSIEEQVVRLLPIVDVAWICRPALNQKYACLVRQHNPRAKVIYDTVDLHYVRLKRSWELLSDSVEEKPQLEQEWRGMQNHELHMARYADLTLTVTPVEKDALKEQGIPHVEVVPNIHQPYPGEGKSFGERKGILFIGGYKHVPNIDAVEWLCQSIMPLVWQYLPDVTVTLLGSHPPEEVKALESDRVKVTGYIHDVSPYFLSHRIFVSPLRYGAGMKGKIGQSLEYGLPVISTQVGAEGMGLVHERDVLISDRGDDFARQIIRLYKNEELWSELAGNAKKAIDPYTPEFVKVSLAKMMKKLVIN